MVIVRGDTHGEYGAFLDIDNHIKSYKDICIICGDCGLIFKNNAAERRILDDLEARPYTIAFVDGNHENFDALYEYPEEMWHGGRVHRIRNNIVHLCRGQIFTIDGNSFFTFGGGYSLDKSMRTPHRSWWKEEMPTDEEYLEGKKNLESHNWAVDYIITHTANIETIKLLGTMDRYSAIKCAMPEEAPLNLYLEDIRNQTAYKRWFFGHFHKDAEIPYTRQTALYSSYVEIAAKDITKPID